MQLVCRLCSRHNPPIAQFCWYDGVALDNAGAGGVVLPAGARLFPMPFVFPSGRNCRNFDELVLACETLWSEAQQLLVAGHLGAFLGGVGRSDLALAASQAARHADRDQGLDDLLSRFPSTARTAALLVVDPAEVNLGQLDRATSHAFPVHVENAGMGLLRGSVACDNTPWLSLGDAQGGSRQKLFQTRFKQTFSVHVNVKALPASDKPLEGRLLIESNGGTTVLRVLAAPLPVAAFSEGVLAGCRTPRQICEKARANPREAAILFERGRVAAWYASNGWVYPVQGPASSGLAAVQQFFEALGLVKPPKVEISPLMVEMSGAPGASVTATLLAHTLEKRAVWAHATTDAPWLQAGRAVLDGRSARVPLTVTNVPAMPGSCLEAEVNVTANGNQRFTVWVRLQVLGRAGNTARVSPGVLSPGLQQPTAAAPVANPWFLAPAAPGALHASMSAVAEPLLIPVSPVVRRDPSPQPAAPVLRPQAVAESPVLLLDPYSAAPQPALRPAAVPTVHPEPVETNEDTGDGLRLVARLAPLGVLLLALFGVGLHDLLFVHAAKPTAPVEPVSEQELHRRDAEERQKREDELATGVTVAPIDPNPYLQLSFHTRGTFEPNVQSLSKPTMRFGIKVVRDPTDPPRERGDSPILPTRPQRLVFHEEGATNNTCVRIDKRDYLFGSNSPGGRGHWVEMGIPLGKDRFGRERTGLRSIWEIDESHVRITQEVEVVASGVRSNERVRRLDTCLITWNIENLDSRPHKVGLRFLLDTFIGENDGVPFMIPGKQLCSTSKQFFNDDVPDYLEAYENDNLANPGTIARLTFRVNERLEPPGEVILGGWPNIGLQQIGKREANGPDTLWYVPVVKIAELHDRDFVVKNERGKKVRAPADSAVTMFWGEAELPAGKKRLVGFAYGLGSVSVASPESKMLLTLGRPYEKKFKATALVLNPVDRETLTLTLPPGLVSEEPLTRTVPAIQAESARPISAVTWALRAERAGSFVVQVKSSRGFTEQQTVIVRAIDKKTAADPEKGLFD